MHQRLHIWFRARFLVRFLVHGISLLFWRGVVHQVDGEERETTNTVTGQMKDGASERKAKQRDKTQPSQHGLPRLDPGLTPATEEDRLHSYAVGCKEAFLLVSTKPTLRAKDSFIYFRSQHGAWFPAGRGLSKQTGHRIKIANEISAIYTGLYPKRVLQKSTGAKT